MAELESLDGIGIVVDPRSRTTIRATDGLSSLLGHSMPEQIEDLVTLGIVSRREFDRVMHHLDSWRTLDQIEGRGQDTSHSWTDEVRIEPLGRPAVLVGLSVVHLRRPEMDAEAVIATLHRLDPTATRAGTASPRRAEEPTALWTLLDHELRVVAADPRLADLGIDPRSKVGVLGSILTHPEDVEGIHQAVLELVTGSRRVFECTVRVAAVDGAWRLARVKLRRLETAGQPMIIVLQRFITETRSVFPRDVLSASEEAVVFSLFQGLRPAAVADDRNVSLNTVRKQLASAYRKLEVSGHAQLVAQYYPPHSR